MNKGQGLTASAIVITGILLRPALTSSPVPASSSATPAKVTATVSSKHKSKDGPWKASCDYWKPGHWIDDSEKTSSSEHKSPNLDIHINEQGTSFESQVTGSLDEPDTSCGSDGWGIPVSGSGEFLHITALIATVPDPIHSSLAIEFDRSIDVLMQAAGQNRYVGSHYWLPWRHPLDIVKSERPADAASEKEDLERETQPGLIIFKWSSSLPRPTHEPNQPPVLYLFLIAQTPALGVNGDQLQNALHYEADLEKHGAALSFKGLDQADIIGPYNSGAAASLRAGLDSAHLDPKITKISVAGITSTNAAADVLNSAITPGPKKIEYLSFGDNTTFEQIKFANLFSTPKSGASRIAFLSESGTVYGQVTSLRWEDVREPLRISFPREISLLRNAQKDDSALPSTAADAAANPYLHLSLKDMNAEDSVPHFSLSLTPYSQEAQWMAIVRELKRRRIEVVAISASNPLDLLFLAKLLHRDLPDARLATVSSSDLMFAHYGDNAPYLGSISFTAYPFTALSRFGSSQSLHGFANASTEDLYNAAIYTFWDGIPSDLHLNDYSNPFDPDKPLHPSLWATTVGRDGYYPLGIVDQCASDFGKILPTITNDGKLTDTCKPVASPRPLTRNSFNSDHPTFPAFSWYVLCIVITLLCVAHSFVLLTANFWSPFSRDLAIEKSDEPRRRAVYVHIATAMLLSMSFVTAFPVYSTLPLLLWSTTTVLFAAITISSAIIATVLTLRRTRSFKYKAKGDDSQKAPAFRRTLTRAEADNLVSEAALYPVFNAVALITAVAIVVLWAYICENDHGRLDSSFVGLFFSYRCLFPASGVSPLLPILLLLFTWYLWALLQTKRLRFSRNSRPMLPKGIPSLNRPVPLYVSDDALDRCSTPIDSCLYENITCLLITRQIIRRFFPTLDKKRPRQLIRRLFSKPGRNINAVLAIIYLAGFVTFVLGLPIQSLDRFLRNPLWHVTPYEFLISALFYPLLVIAITGCVRLLFIWASLSRGLLEPLERGPLRFAFSRLADVAWMTMLRQGGLFEYWRDMSRSTEAIQQMSHISEIRDAMDADHAPSLQKPAATGEGLQYHIGQLIDLINGTAGGDKAGKDKKGKQEEENKDIGGEESKDKEVKAVKGEEGQDNKGDQPSWSKCGNFLSGKDLPDPSNRGELNLMCAIEYDYATFAEALLAGVLVPYWQNQRCSPVEADLPTSAAAKEDKHESEKASEPSASKACSDPPHIRLAEEFLAIRYVSLIRSVLINLRQLMIFVSAAFVFAMIAWNSYPFQPRQVIDWAFTGLLFVFGAAVIWVFAQMHRNPILSRITGTRANELGGEFYIRLAAFGAVPVLTWLASQFPAIGSSISGLLQSGSGFAK